MIRAQKLPFTGLWEKRGWKRLQELSMPTSCLKHCHWWGQIRLCRVLTRWRSKTSEYGDCASSLGNLLCCLAVLVGRKFLLVSGQNLSFQFLFSLVLLLYMSLKNLAPFSVQSYLGMIYFPTVLVCKCLWNQDKRCIWSYAHVRCLN